MADTIPGNTSSTATLALGTPSSSAIDTLGDSDWWGIQLTQGFGYLIDVRGADTSNGTLADPWLWVYSAGGTVLGYDDDSGYGLDAFVYFVPSASGIYFIAAEDASDSATGTYAISVYYDVLASTATAATLTVGSGGSSSIDFYGDYDWTAIILTAGETYLFDLKGSSTASGTLADPWIGIADGSGQLLWADDDLGSGLNSQLIFTPAATGTYYLIGGEAYDSGLGTYTVQTANISTVATSLAVGGSVTGTLQSSSEIDIYRVDAAVGTVLTVSFDAPQGLAGYPFEIQVVSHYGPLMTQWFSGTDFSFTVGAPAGGTGYLKVTPGTSYSAAQYGITLTSEAFDFSTVPTSTIKPLTGDDVVDATTHGYYWTLNSARTVTWAIADNGNAYWTDAQGAIDRIDDVLANFAAVSNIHFRGLGYYTSLEVANTVGADIVITLDGANQVFSGSSVWALAFFPSTSTTYNPYPGAAGDVWINVNSAASMLSYEPGAAGYFLALHELGHALGLKHPFDDGGTGHPTYNQAGIGGVNFDWATVMSYSDDFDWNLRAWDPATLMPLDVIGMQSIYGANTSTNSGNNAYSLTANNYYQTIWDPSGNDSVSISGATEGWTILLPVIPLAESVSTLTGFALPTSQFELSSPLTLYWMMGDIENATGSGFDDIIIGSEPANLVAGLAGNDTLAGGPGNDTLDGGAGADWLYGGTGDDAYYVDGQPDLAFENTGEGTDTVISSASFYLYAGIEKLVLASGAGDVFGSANELDNTLSGNEGVNLLLGWDGADTISGGGGNDVIYGVSGADSLLGEAGIDVLVAGEANDTLDGGAEPDLLFGEAGNDVLYGGTGFATDILVGGEGNDSLDGSASAASGQTRNEGDYDLMYGGTGNDTYHVDTPADLTFETVIDGGGGTDTVIADITGAGYYLYADVENLELRGNTPYGVGNELDNVLTGNGIPNYLLGGAGNDTLNGGENGVVIAVVGVPFPSDVLFGESGADTFVFEHGTGGDVVGDFQVGVDKLKLVGVGYTSFADLNGHMVQDGNVMAIDLGAGDFVVLHNVTIASLSSGDFIFG